MFVLRGCAALESSGSEVNRGQELDRIESPVFAESLHPHRGPMGIHQHRAAESRQAKPGRDLGQEQREQYAFYGHR